MEFRSCKVKEEIKMTYFQRDLEYLINEGVFASKRGQVRFVFHNRNILKGELELLNLDERAYNTLRRNKIDTIEQVTEKFDDIFRLKGAGKKVVKEVKNAYLQYYYAMLNPEEREQFWNDSIEATAIM